MRKIKIFLISLITIAVFAFTTNVYAAGANISTNSTVYVGDNFTVTANVTAAAAWNIHVNSTGPVSGCSILEADATGNALNANKSFSVTCKATAIGTITITLSGDVTDQNGNNSNVSGTRQVNVIAKPAPPSNNNNNKQNNTRPNQNNTQDNRSSNNNLRSVSVAGYQLVKVDANHYTLTVPNDVESINISATPEDSKARVTGGGSHAIKIGENSIDLVVTAENGTQNRINIKVTRKDGFYLEDLDTLLNSDKTGDINITIKEDTVITAKDLEKIKNSKKTVNFNYYDADKKLKYSWIIDGSKLTDTNDLLTTINNEVENKKAIQKLSNYADSLYVNLKQGDNLPAGAKIKLYIGDKYEDGDLVNIYAYLKDKNKLKLLDSKLEVKDGYIEFDVANVSNYLVTMSTIADSEKEVVKPEEKKRNLLPIIGIICILVLGFICFILLKKRKKSDENIEVLSDEPEETTEEVVNTENLVQDNTTIDNTNSSDNTNNL